MKEQTKSGSPRGKDSSRFLLVTQPFNSGHKVISASAAFEADPPGDTRLQGVACYLDSLGNNAGVCVCVCGGRTSSTV